MKRNAAVTERVTAKAAGGDHPSGVMPHPDGSDRIGASRQAVPAKAPAILARTVFLA